MEENTCNTFTRVVRKGWNVFLFAIKTFLQISPQKSSGKKVRWSETEKRTCYTFPSEFTFAHGPKSSPIVICPFNPKWSEKSFDELLLRHGASTSNRPQISPNRFEIMTLLDFLICYDRNNKIRNRHKFWGHGVKAEEFPRGESKPLTGKMVSHHVFRFSFSLRSLKATG